MIDYQIEFSHWSVFWSGNPQKPIEYDRSPETREKKAKKIMALPGYNIRATPSHAMTHEDDSESTLEKMIPDHHDLGNVRRFESRFRNGIDHQPVPPPKMIVKDKRNRDTRTQR